MVHSARVTGSGLRATVSVGLTLFILAGLTGAWFRFGLIYGWSFGFELTNIRHAHSHLMYFGWTTPVLMALVWRHLGERSGQARTLGKIPGILFALSIAAYPLFLIYGYEKTEIGSASIPLAVVVSSLHMVVWYVFGFRYLTLRRRVRWNTVGRLFWDGAVCYLVVSSLGAWALAFMVPFGGAASPLSDLLTHWFLDLFTEGWMVLAVIGLAYRCAPGESDGRQRAAAWLVLAGLPLTFTLGLAPGDVPRVLHWMGRAGGIAVGTGLAYHALQLLKLPQIRRSWWVVPMVLLLLKALVEIVFSAVWAGWMFAPGIRLLYLHTVLLGVVSTGIFTAASRIYRHALNGVIPAFYASVILLLVLLVPMTPLWPPAWQGVWTFRWAAWVSLVPVAAAVAALVLLIRRKVNNGP